MRDDPGRAGAAPSAARWTTTPFWEQASLFEIDAERDQLRKDHDALARAAGRPSRRRASRRRAALRRRYADPTARWFPAAVTFLVPASIAKPEVPDAAPPDSSRRRSPRPGRPGRRGAAATGRQAADGRRSSTPSGSACSARTARSSPSRCSPRRSRRAWTRCRTTPWPSSARPGPRCSEAPDLLTPAWAELVLAELLGYTPAVLAEGGALPADLRTGARRPARPDAVAYGPDGQRRPGGTAAHLPAARRHVTDRGVQGDQPSPAEQAAALCRHRGIPLALLTNGALWVLVHARPGEPADDRRVRRRPVAGGARPAARLRQPARRPPGAAAAEERRRRARHQPGRAVRAQRRGQAEVTTTLGTQVRQAVELLVGELSRLDREAGGALLGEVEPPAGLPGRAHRDDAPGVPAVRRGAAAAAGGLRPVRHGLLGRRPARPARRGAEPVRRGGRRPARRRLAPAAGHLRRRATRAASTTRCASRPTAAACSTRHAIRGWTGSPSPTGWSTRCSARCSS